MSKANFRLLLVLMAIPASLAINKLGTYNIEVGSISTSGGSSGAMMATQFHVAHSSIVNGCGIFAGGPYGCALGLMAEAMNCILTPNLVVMATMYSRVSSYELFNDIDPVSGLVGDRVFVFHGTEDSVVDPDSAKNVETFYDHYSSQVYMKTDIAAQHCIPSDNYGGQCDKLNLESYINNCSYNGIYEMSNYIYSNMIRPNGDEAIVSNLYEFDQKEFFGLLSPSVASMDEIGYVYVPTRCANQVECKLHIAFHGCKQGRTEMGTTYVLNAGYLEVAELNDMIVLFPQVIPKLVENPQGCWDWWGYNNFFYDTTSGDQILPVKKMVDRITGF